MLVSAFLALLSGAPSMNMDIKAFRNSFEVLATAHMKGLIDILAKYGPQVVSDFDLLQVVREPGDRDRDAYDSLTQWVRGAQGQIHLLAALDSFGSLRPTAQAVALGKFEGLILQLPEAGLQEKARTQTEGIARATFGAAPLDTLFAVRKILPSRLAVAVNLDRRLRDGLDEAYREAFNEGGDALARFELRFPGERTTEIEGALAFERVDELNVALKSGDRQKLLEIYKSMTPSPQRNDVGKNLERLYYADWKSAKADAQLRAAQDFIEVFRAEPSHSKRFQEVEDWFYMNTTVPTVAAGAPTAAPGAPTNQVPGAGR